MDKVLHLQLSLFGSFIEIKPETSVVIKLLISLEKEGFVPGSVDITSVDLKSGKMAVESRLQMISPDKTWNIVFLPERIDFNYAYQPNTKIYTCIDELLVLANSFVERVFGIFDQIIGNRLALNCKLALENLSEENSSNICRRFTKPFAAYDVDSYIEWSVRYNSQSKIKVSENNEEECNHVTEITQVEDQNIDVTNKDKPYSVVVLIDINTLPLNLDKRFKYDNLIYFANNANEFISKVADEITRG